MARKFQQREAIPEELTKSTTILKSAWSQKNQIIHYDGEGEREADVKDSGSNEAFEKDKLIWETFKSFTNP